MPDRPFRITCDPNNGYAYGNFGGSIDTTERSDFGLYYICQYKMDHIHDGLMEEEEMQLTGGVR